jgi:hypothetical protein
MNIGSVLSRALLHKSLLRRQGTFEIGFYDQSVDSTSLFLSRNRIDFKSTRLAKLGGYDMIFEVCNGARENTSNQGAECSRIALTSRTRNLTSTFRRPLFAVRT